MTSTVARILTCFATLIAFAAISAPSALAIPRDSWTTNHPLYVQVTPMHPTANHAVPMPQDDHAVPGLHTPTPITGATAFSWSAAGIGALAAAIACAVVIGLVLDVRRRRHPTMA